MSTAAAVPNGLRDPLGEAYLGPANLPRWPTVLWGPKSVVPGGKLVLT